ncbi:TIGR03087 family PEP-CTERM/XrtA system glycosyltransferase [Roseateles koreensis]|uniref:TIGR03087 family PEP-CTERM/XrtA system glycosyltransferase n=1 Tax=Roseateles koreensis TaxID=2987526 RepID=A0ABT5KTA7_9BURK|nr:TIGR03087 family PEP-CTERM/XrtA system glycosyltransferase [Roseateles koreensis]MDC8786174.1 TIGR03087 family PEP-CTERM/XrtA system glycosyltransferase [Roseateles koreensis]
MAKILYLVHRLPYPPNKGDKVRSFHLLKHLAARHEVFLGTFVDDPDDLQYVETVRAFCADLCAQTLQPRMVKLKSARGLVTGEALSLPFYRNPALTHWIAQLAQAQAFDAIVVFSSPMAQYAQAVQDVQPQVPMLVDFVDVDSAKWTDYAQAHAWPMSWVYRREGRKLLEFERATAERAACSFFVTEKETALFQSLTPESPARLETLGNGVDADYFAPVPQRASPFPAGQTPLVFTGAMDYWPNAEAVIWFAKEVLPALLRQRPDLHFVVVGRSPSPAVQALAGPHISVTGTVPDVRPYLQHAAVIVAPLRLARGIQNKILEAMAMSRPVVAASTCVQAIDGVEGRDLLAATEPAEFVSQIEWLLQNPAAAGAMGAVGRSCVLAHYSWEARLSGIDFHLNRALQEVHRA